MANPSKAKGTRAETNVVKYLKKNGIDAKRKALSGNKDEGDIQIIGSKVSLEVKSGKMTDKPSRSQLDEWLRQAEVEGKNCRQICYLVIVRYNRKIDDAEVWWRIDSNNNRYRMMYLSDWVISGV